MQTSSHPNLSRSQRPQADWPPSWRPGMLLAPEGDAGAAPPAVPAPTPNVLNLDAKVMLDGKEVPISELVAARGEAEKLRGVRDAFLSYNDSSSDPQKLFDTTKRMLEGMGYPNAEDLARQHVESQFGQTQESDRSADDGEMPAWAKSLVQKIEDQDRRMSEFGEMSIAARAEQMTNHLRESVSKALVGDDDARTMVESLTRINGEEAVKALQERIRRTTLQNLNDRKAKTGRLDPSWISEETARATKQEMASLRSVIGDPNRLGRSTETESDRDFLIRKTKPVQQPQASRKTTEANMDQWLNDELFRAANADGTGSPNRI